jgi:hypothetical protein
LRLGKLANVGDRALGILVEKGIIERLKATKRLASDYFRLCIKEKNSQDSPASKSQSDWIKPV